LSVASIPNVNRALFLDRDGVINTDGNYVHRIEDFEFVPGIFELCLSAQDAGFMPIVVTNQAGIGRGYYTEQDFADLTAWMLEQFIARGVRIGRVYHCPYHPTAGVGTYRRDSFDRKPNPGMILHAKRDFDFHLAACVLIGDKESDLVAGRAAGVGFNVRLRQGADANVQGSLEFSTLLEIGDWFGRTFGRPSPG